MARIRIKNNASVNIGNDEEYALKISSYSNLPEGFIWLVFYNDSLPDKQAVCVPKKLLRFSGYPYSHIIDGNDFVEPWNCYIAISRRWCDKSTSFPAYFTYLIGHELGHARICLSDLLLHKHYCLVERTIKKASDGYIRYCHELPHEILFDRFGKFFAHKVFGTEKLQDEIEVLKECADPIEKMRLEVIQSLQALDDFRGLREDLIRISNPYKENLISLWKESVRRNGNNCLASTIDDYDTLFQ